MKGIFFSETGSIEKIKFGDLPERNRELNNGFLRLKFLAGSLNHLDLWVVKGLPSITYNFPHIAGADICGEVVESKSERFKKGDRVILYPAESEDTKSSLPENLRRDFKIRGESTRGVFEEEVTVHERYVFAAPSHLTANEAAALPLVYLTAWQMVFEKAGPLHPDLTILVHGAGSGVSQAILDYLLHSGIKNIGLTSRETSKLKSWEQKGIRAFLFSESLESEIKNWAKPDRVHVIFDHIGVRTFEMNIRLLASGGRLITCGATSGFEAKLDLRHLFFRQLQLLGSTMGSLQHFSEMLQFICEKKIKPQISAVIPWSRPIDAYRQLESSAQNGKVILSA